MQLFENTVKLRGFLTEAAKTPESYMLTEHSFATLTLATTSGVWDLGANRWHPRTDSHRVICPGPYFCGLVRGMRRGDYVEVEGELRSFEQDRPVETTSKRDPVKSSNYAVRAIRVTRLDRPDALVDYGDSDNPGTQQSGPEAQS